MLKVVGETSFDWPISRLHNTGKYRKKSRHLVKFRTSSATSVFRGTFDLYKEWWLRFKTIGNKAVIFDVLYLVL